MWSASGAGTEPSAPCAGVRGLAAMLSQTTVRLPPDHGVCVVVDSVALRRLGSWCVGKWLEETGRYQELALGKPISARSDDVCCQVCQVWAHMNMNIALSYLRLLVS